MAPVEGGRWRQETPKIPCSWHSIHSGKTRDPVSNKEEGEAQHSRLSFDLHMCTVARGLGRLKKKEKRSDKAKEQQDRMTCACSRDGIW